MPTNIVKPNGSRPALTSVADLFDEPSVACRNVVAGRLPVGGLSAWAGKPKAGKDTALRNIVCEVARKGDSFLGRVELSGPTVYLALEDKRDEVKAHFRALGATDEPIFIHTGPVPGDRLQFLETVVERYRPMLIVISPVGRFLRIKDYNDYSEVTDKTDPLIRIASESGAHIAFAHHAGKTVREGGDALLGSTAFFGAVDTVVVIRRDERGVRTIETVQRYDDDLVPTVLHLDRATGRLTLGKGRGAEDVDRVKSNLIALLRTQAFT